MSKLKYTISTKSRSGAYSVVNKEMTQKQFDDYYDGIVANGGKVVGYTTEEI